jgi:hypothetical protein
LRGKKYRRKIVPSENTSSRKMKIVKENGKTFQEILWNMKLIFFFATAKYYPKPSESLAERDQDLLNLKMFTINSWIINSFLRDFILNKIIPFFTVESQIEMTFLMNLGRRIEIKFYKRFRKLKILKFWNFLKMRYI